MREIYRQVTNWQCHCIFTSPRGWKSTSLFFLGAVFWCNRRPGCGIFRWKKQSFWDFCIMFIHLFAIFCYGFLRELWGPAWAVCSYSRSPPAGGIPKSSTLRMTGWTTLYFHRPHWDCFGEPPATVTALALVSHSVCHVRPSLLWWQGQVPRINERTNAG